MLGPGSGLAADSRCRSADRPRRAFSRRRYCTDDHCNSAYVPSRFDASRRPSVPQHPGLDGPAARRPGHRLLAHGQGADAGSLRAAAGRPRLHGVHLRLQRLRRERRRAAAGRDAGPQDRRSDCRRRFPVDLVPDRAAIARPSRGLRERAVRAGRVGPGSAHRPLRQRRRLVPRPARPGRVLRRRGGHRAAARGRQPAPPARSRRLAP